MGVKTIIHGATKITVQLIEGRSFLCYDIVVKLSDDTEFVTTIFIPSDGSVQLEMLLPDTRKED